MFFAMSLTYTTRNVQRQPSWFIILDINISLESDIKYTAKQNFSFSG